MGLSVILGSAQYVDRFEPFHHQQMGQSSDYMGYVDRYESSFDPSYPYGDSDSASYGTIEDYAPRRPARPVPPYYKRG